MFFLAKLINEKKSLYRNAFDRKNPANIDKNILHKSKTVKMPKVKLIISKSKHPTSIWSK